MPSFPINTYTLPGVWGDNTLRYIIRYNTSVRFSSSENIKIIGNKKCGALIIIEYVLDHISKFVESLEDYILSVGQLDFVIKNKKIVNVIIKHCHFYKEKETIEILDMINSLLKINIFI